MVKRQPARYICALAIIHITIVLSPGLAFASSTTAWDSLIDELKANFPALIAQRKQAESLGATPDANMALMDPMIEVGMMNLPTNSFRTDQEPMTEKGVTIIQPIPNYAKRDAARQLAGAEADVALVRVDVMTADLVARLKKAVYEVAYVDKALDSLSENGKLMDELISAANAKYGAGTGPQSAVIQAQVERSRLMEKRFTLSERRKVALIKINRLLGRPMTTEFHPESLPMPTPVAFDEQAAVADAIKNSPTIREAAAMVEKAQKNALKEEAGLTWDYNLTAKYGQREPKFESDLFSVSAGVNVPLWRTRKQDKLIAGARIAVEESEARLADAKREVEASLRQIAASAQREMDTISLYKTGILPQTELAVASARAAYQLDKTEFAALLNSEITLLQYSLEMEESVMRLRGLGADVESMTGSASSFKIGSDQ